MADDNTKRPAKAGSADSESSRLWALSGLGFQIASEVAGGALLGWVADIAFGTLPYGILIGSIMGVVVAMRSLFKAAQAASRADQKRWDARRQRSTPPDDGV